MFGEQAMPRAVLAEMLGRLATSLSAGIDLRRAWSAEAGRMPRRWRSTMEQVSRGLAAGEPLADAMGRAGGAFPPVVLGMIAVGDATGHEAETLREVSEMLRAGVRSTRELVRSLVGPAFQLSAAVAVVGLLILIAGFIRDGEDRPVDILGIGLSGLSGLLTYLAAVAASLAVLAVAGKLLLGSWRRHGLARWLAAVVPVVGPAARAAEAAAWCRAASLSSGAGLPAGRLASLASAAAPGISIDPAALEERLRSGASLADALTATARLPRRVLEAIDVGELTGNTAEVLSRLAEDCDEEARQGFSAAARGVGFIAWGLVAGLIALVVYRIFSFYLGMLQDALRI
jgi:type II secretory pathway component PulF